MQSNRARKKISCALDTSQVPEIPFSKPLAIEAELVQTEQGLRAALSSTANVQRTCDRCLASFTKQIPLAFDQEYRTDVHSTEKEELRILPIEPGETIDLFEPVRQEIILMLPVKALCRPNCKGFCGECGANLNIQACQHHQE